MDWTTVLGSIMIVGSAVWSAVQWYMGRTKADNPPTVEEIASAVLEVLKRLQEQDTPVKFSAFSVPVQAPPIQMGPAIPSPESMTRMQAMEHVEALAGYLEAKDAADGLDALQTVLLALVPSQKRVVAK